MKMTEFTHYHQYDDTKTLLENSNYKTIKMGDTTVILEMVPPEEDKRFPDGSIHIASIRTPRAKRGQGSAGAALQYLVDRADAQGITMTLGASPLDSKTRLDKLVEFYKKYGFEPTGKSINYAGEPEMVRYPR